MFGFQKYFFNPISADAALSTKAVNKSQTHMSWEMVFKEFPILNKNELNYELRNWTPIQSDLSHPGVIKHISKTE